MIWKILSAALALVALAVGIPALRHLSEVPPPPPPVVRAQLAIPRGVTLGSGPEPLDAAISPSETNIVFVGTQDGTTRLWLESLSSGTARPLDGTDGASMPAWTRDGGSVAFFAKGKLNLLSVASGAVSAIADAPAPAGVTCLDDGSVLFVADAGSVVRKLVNGVSSDVTTLAPGDVSHAFPFVDEGGRLLYVALRENGAPIVRLVTDGRSTDLTETAGHAELHDSVLLHVRDDVLLAQRLDEEGTRLIGRSTPLATGVGHSDRGHGYFASSRRMALWAAALPRATELAWFDMTGRRTGTATEPGDYWQVRLSPSGRDAAVTTLDPLLRTLDVIVVPLAAPGNARRVSLAIGPDTDPVWSPNGASVVYRSAQSGPGAILERPAAQSSRPEESVLRKGVDVTPSDWRGNTILFHAPGEGGTRVVFAFDRTRGTETPVTRPGFNSWSARWSSSGAWVAYTSDEGGQAEIYVQAWPEGTPRVRATFGGGQRPQWGPAGTLYFLRGDTIMRTTLTGGPSPAVSTPQPVLTAEGLRDFAISPEGDRILAVAAAPGSTVAEGHLILDWPSAVPPPPTPNR